MSIDVSAEIFIERPPEEVAEVMFNPKRDKIWIRSLVEVFPMEAGLYRKGAKVERVGDFASRRYSSKVLVTSSDEKSLVELYMDEPFEMKQRYTIKESEGGSLAKIRVSSMGELLYNSPVSILSKMVREDVEDSLKNLKKFLESD